MSSEPVAATDLDPNKNGYFFPGRKHMTWTKQTKNLSRKLCLLILQISSEKNAGMKGVGGNINCGHEDLIRSSYLSHGINKVYQDVILRGCRFPPGQIGQTPWGSPEFMLYPAKISLILCKPHWSHILHRSGQIVVVFSPDSSRPFRFFLTIWWWRITVWWNMIYSFSMLQSTTLRAIIVPWSMYYMVT